MDVPCVTSMDAPCVTSMDAPCVTSMDVPWVTGKPDPPHNCRAYDVTISSLQVSCLPGDDGGLGQTFLLRVLEANGDFDDVAQVTRETASFSVANLRPATAYRLLVTATNAKGESRPAELRAYTVALNHPQHETPAEPTRGRESGAEVAVGVLVGAVLACLPVAIAVVVMGVRTCMRLRAARRGRTAEESEKYAAEMEAGSTGRPLLTGQGTPGSGGGGSAESGSDITTITGGVAISSSTMPPTPSSGQSDTQVTQVSTTETSNLLYPAGRLYSPDRAQEVVGPQVLTANAANLRRGPYNPLEEKFDGDNELLEITLPPPAAYDQGYQSSYSGCQPRDQRYQTQEQGPQRLKQGYQQAFREYQPVLPGSHHLPAAAYPAVAIKGGHPSLQYISSAAMTQDYHFPSKDPTSAVTKVTGSSSFATLPHSKVTSSSSFATLPINKDAGQDTRMDDPKMSTLYNPLAMFASSPSYAQKCGSTAGMSERGLTTGSLKRGVKPQGQDVLRIRDNPRNRSASLSSVTSKRESSV
ncbi:uncharacterized protein LOC121854105 [Homarus americanus]|uniref:uncharacterized protein LOC121854105 n=1 Tax=Homarus americanus TaxID=6706 RepID=UPI001C4813F8|nr:uncharacterized protein LOC121854105 [Homarus americanus]